MLLYHLCCRRPYKAIANHSGVIFIHDISISRPNTPWAPHQGLEIEIMYSYILITYSLATIYADSYTLQSPKEPSVGLLKPIRLLRPKAKDMLVLYVVSPLPRFPERRSILYPAYLPAALIWHKDTPKRFYGEGSTQQTNRRTQFNVMIQLTTFGNLAILSVYVSTSIVALVSTPLVMALNSSISFTAMSETLRSAFVSIRDLSSL